MPLAIIPEGLDGVRADVGAVRLFGFSRSMIEQASENANLFLDSVPISKSTRLRAGSVLEVAVPDVKRVRVIPQEVADMGIIYDDDDIVVVNKPPGVASHPSLGWSGPSVVEHLAAAGFRISTSGPPERQGVVSRLDVGTSGLMVVAKSEEAYSALKKGFRNREVTKVYHSLVQGYPDPLEGVIDAPIVHARADEWKMAVDPQGKPAETRYSTMEAFSRATLLDVRPRTGRTHQIRVHMSAIHHPCAGDLVYGADPAMARQLGLKRQWLHAAQLGFRHPTMAKDVWFVAPYPVDLEKSLEIVRTW